MELMFILNLLTPHRLSLGLCSCETFCFLCCPFFVSLSGKFFFPFIYSLFLITLRFISICLIVWCSKNDGTTSVSSYCTWVITLRHWYLNSFHLITFNILHYSIPGEDILYVFLHYIWLLELLFFLFRSAVLISNSISPHLDISVE